jgi:hypothetical protein
MRLLLMLMVVGSASQIYRTAPSDRPPDQRLVEVKAGS